jgi:hypothetical protein
MVGRVAADGSRAQTEGCDVRRHFLAAIFLAWTAAMTRTQAVEPYLSSITANGSGTPCTVGFPLRYTTSTVNTEGSITFTASQASVAGASGGNVSPWQYQAWRSSTNNRGVAQMTNVTADGHGYDHESDFDANLQTATADIARVVAAAQTVRSADGLVPVVMAEYRPSTADQNFDPGGFQDVAVTNLGSSGGPAGSFNPNNPAASGYQLTFDDEFNAGELDATKWSPTWAWGNGINSTYPEDEAVPRNIVLNNNIAQFILSRRGTRSGLPYASSVATTYQKFSQQYGYWEARVQMPVPPAHGMWDAFWLLPADRTWPPEIDIIEWLGNNPTTAWMTVHYGSTNLYNQSAPTGPDLSAGFHVISILWTPESVTWYLDGTQTFTSTVGVPHVPMYIILDNDTGGWKGNAVDTTTAFPAVMSVNWVRVWAAPSRPPLPQHHPQ